MAVDKAEHCGSTLRSGPRVEGDRLEAGRRADGRDPLLPFIGMLWLSISVQEQVAAEVAAAFLLVCSRRRVARSMGGAALRRRWVCQ